LKPAVLGSAGLRFLVVGAANTVVTYALYCLLVLWLPPLVAYGLVYALGILIAYLGNSLWVFDAGVRVSALIAYPLVYLVPFLANLGSIELLGRLGVGPRLALALSLVWVLPLSFLLNRAYLTRRGV
jgi:putative flippase GtrA